MQHQGPTRLPGKMCRPRSNPSGKAAPGISSPAHLKNLPRACSLKQSEKLGAGGGRKSGSIAWIKVGLLLGLKRSVRSDEQGRGHFGARLAGR